MSKINFNLISKAYDTNKDNFINKSELSISDEQLRKIDKDGDQKVSVKELAKSLSKGDVMIFQNEVVDNKFKGRLPKFYNQVRSFSSVTFELMGAEVGRLNRLPEIPAKPEISKDNPNYKSVMDNYKTKISDYKNELFDYIKKVQPKLVNSKEIINSAAKKEFPLKIDFSNIQANLETAKQNLSTIIKNITTGNDENLEPLNKANEQILEYNSLIETTGDEVKGIREKLFYNSKISRVNSAEKSLNEEAKLINDIPEAIENLKKEKAEKQSDNLLTGILKLTPLKKTVKDIQNFRGEKVERKMNDINNISLADNKSNMIELENIAKNLYETLISAQVNGFTEQDLDQIIDLSNQAEDINKQAYSNKRSIQKYSK